jgi:MYXO-CTERM domain-containing protein
VPCSASRVVPGAHRVVGRPREVHTTRHPSNSPWGSCSCRVVRPRMPAAGSLPHRLPVMPAHAPATGWVPFPYLRCLRDEVLSALLRLPPIKGAWCSSSCVWPAATPPLSPLSLSSPLRSLPRPLNYLSTYPRTPGTSHAAPCPGCALLFVGGATMRRRRRPFRYNSGHESVPCELVVLPSRSPGEERWRAHRIPAAHTATPPKDPIARSVLFPGA